MGQCTAGQSDTRRRVILRAGVFYVTGLRPHTVRIRSMTNTAVMPTAVEKADTTQMGTATDIGASEPAAERIAKIVVGNSWSEVVLSVTSIHISRDGVA